MQEEVKSYQKKIVWVSSLILDVHLHKTGTIEILRALKKRGHKVVLFASFSSNKQWREEIKDIDIISIPLRYIPIFSTPAYVLMLFLYLPLFVLYWKPDFLITPSEATVLSLAPTLLLPKSNRPKFVLAIRSTPVLLFGIRGRLKRLFFNFSLYVSKKSFQGITILTELMKKELCIKYNLNPEHIDVWTAGVSTTDFRSENFSKAEMRKQLGLEDKFIVFYHGVISELRGIIETVRAIQLLKNLYPNIYLFLLGNSSLSLKKFIHELDLQNMVKLHDRVSYLEVPKYIAMCDVGIVPLPNLPDWRYQCPLKLLEYLAMEKVVIVTDIPANREVIGKSKCGIYAPSVDPINIANSIIYAYNNRKDLQKWGIYGRTIIEKKYSWEKIGEKCENYLLKI